MIRNSPINLLGLFLLYNKIVIILIKNAQIIDGSGKQSFFGDVLIKNDKITAVGGRLSYKKADKVIEARGLHLLPGFIDINTDSDHYLTLFSNPSQESFLLQGVTTIVGGNCGSSLAPLMKGTLESVKKWGDIEKFSVGWRSLDDFFEVLKRIKLGVNFGTLIGHSTIRNPFLFKEPDKSRYFSLPYQDRDLTEGELEKLKNILEEAFEQGALGLSLGLAYSSSGNAPYPELQELAKLTALKNKVLTVHLRDYGANLMDSISEIIKLATETGVKTEISHLRPKQGNQEDWQFSLEALDKFSHQADINFDFYPYDFSAHSINALIPEWLRQSPDLILKKIPLPLEQQILEEIKGLKFKGNEIIISQAPGNEYLIGKNLSEISKNQKLSLPKTVMKIMRLCRMKAIIFMKDSSERGLIQAIGNRQSFIASNDASYPISPKGNYRQQKILAHPRSLATFPKYLSLIKNHKLLTFEEGIRKITSEPAQKFSLKLRGLVKEGYFADLSLFDLNNLNEESRAAYVLVNGVLSVEDSKFNGKRSGQIIKA